MSQLLDQLRSEIRVRHYSIRTEHTYIGWVAEFVRFHNLRHPSEMGGPEINQFLSHLACNRNVAASTQNQALSAILFLYQRVLNKDIGALGEVVRAKRPERLPTVLSVEETERILAHISGTHKLMVLLLYGAGMRLMEVIRLRVKDVDFDQNAIIVRDGKGQKDRAVPLPKNTVAALHVQIANTKRIHDQDLRDGYGTVYLPFALERKYPNTNKAFHWQYIFPSTVLSVDPRSGRKQRHHIFESVLQEAIKTATTKAGVRKDVHAHTFRHSFASHLLASGTDIRSIQELLGHKDVSTTMIYTHIMKSGPLGIVSPSDRINVEAPVLVALSDGEQPQHLPAQQLAATQGRDGCPHVSGVATPQRGSRQPSEDENRTAPVGHADLFCPPEQPVTAAYVGPDLASGRVVPPNSVKPQPASRGQNLLKALRRVAAAVLMFLVGRHP